MKKTFFLLNILFFLLIAAHAQVAEVGRFMADGYISYSNYNKLTKLLAVGTNKLQSRHIPIIGLRGQYVCSPHWTAGAELNYMHSRFNWQQDTAAAMAKSGRFAVLGRAEFHPLLENNLDVYLGVATGLALQSRHRVVAGGNFDSFKGNFTFRASIGGRYFFSKYVGVNAELGVGGYCLMQAGIAARLNDSGSRRKGRSHLFRH